MTENEEIVTIQNKSERNCEGTEQLQKIICNCCGRELKRCGARYEDHLHIIKSWGYLSEQDGIVEEMDICPDCLENWERIFVIAPKKYRVTELL